MKRSVWFMTLVATVGCTGSTPPAPQDDAASRYAQYQDLAPGDGANDTDANSESPEGLQPTAADADSPAPAPNHTTTSDPRLVEQLRAISDRLEGLENKMNDLTTTLEQTGDDIAARIDSIQSPEVDDLSPAPSRPLSDTVAPPPSPDAGSVSAAEIIAGPSFRDAYARMRRPNREIRATRQHAARLGSPARLFGGLLEVVAPLQKLAKGTTYPSELCGSLDQPQVGERIAFAIDTTTDGSWFVNPADNAVALSEDLWADAEVVHVTENSIITAEVQYLVIPSRTSELEEIAIPIRATIDRSLPQERSESLVPRRINDAVQGLMGDFNAALTSESLARLIDDLIPLFAEEPKVFTAFRSTTPDRAEGLLVICEDASF